MPRQLLITRVSGAVAWPVILLTHTYRFSTDVFGVDYTASPEHDDLWVICSNAFTVLTDRNRRQHAGFIVPAT